MDQCGVPWEVFLARGQNVRAAVKVRIINSKIRATLIQDSGTCGGSAFLATEIK